MITKLTLQIGDKEIALTDKEARQLKDALADLFGEKETVYVPQIVERWRDRPWWPYWQPYITWNAQADVNAAVDTWAQASPTASATLRLQSNT